MTEAVETTEELAPFTEGDREIAYRAEAVASSAAPGERPAVIGAADATGRRKEAVARVKLALGVGKATVNGKSLQDYFKTETMSTFVVQPLVLADALKKYDVVANVSGGGLRGQAGALRHGLARALVAADETSREKLKGGGFLTRDPRMKERKKTGQPGARRRFQFSKR